MSGRAIVALLLFVGCRPHGPAAGASLELPPNASDQARRFQLPRSPTGDSDRDGVLERDDACPRELEDYDGDADLDGCPDDGVGLVQVDEETGAIELAFGHELEFADDGEPVFLDWHHEEALRQLVWFLRAHPRFRIVEIEEVGERSGCRHFACEHPSTSVRMFLVAHGIAPDRIRVHPRVSSFVTLRDDDHVFAGRPTSRVELAVRGAAQ